MICPSCGHDNLPGHDECSECLASLMQEDVPGIHSPSRWRAMVDPVSSLGDSGHELLTVPAGTSLADAVAGMQQRNVGYVLVTDAEGRLVGILTEFDVLQRIAGHVRDLAAHKVDEFMTRNPTTLKADEPIKHALHFMGLDELTYIPLVDAQNRPKDLLSVRRLTTLIENME
jgi:arabinose-5-phosphate isomerase